MAPQVNQDVDQDTQDQAVRLEKFCARTDPQEVPEEQRTNLLAMIELLISRGFSFDARWTSLASAEEEGAY